MSNTQIICHDLPNCPVCKSSGTVIYTGLKDFLSDIPGDWSMRRCDDKKCSTIWLDPAPTPENVHLLYSDYHTHGDPVGTSPAPKKGLRKLLSKINEAVLAEELGYDSNLPKSTRKIFNLISKIHPGWVDEKKNQVLYVPYQHNGKLLDVGCGAGNAMQILQNKGWNVTGTDFDLAAVENARKKGLDVHHGDLIDINFPANSFDEILCCNVIEHTTDPKGLLEECYRLLKPGGHLTMITNSSVSRGHKRFKQHWRGLEIPRHLQIFTPASLENLSRQAGFEIAEGKNCLQGIYYMWDASKEHERSGSFELPNPTKWDRIMGLVKSFTAGLRLRFFSGSEESILLYCTKNK